MAETELKGKRLWQRIWTLDCRTPEIPEDLTKVDGYGDPKSKFKLTEPPDCMNYPTIFKDENGDVAKTIWEEDDQKLFIAQEIIRCYLTGYWCYIKGKLTWLPPWYYFFLNYWRVPVDTVSGRLEYRDAQNRILTFVWNVLYFTRCLGVVYLKGRRNFASAIGHAMAYIETTRGHNRHAGLSSSDEGLSEENFTEMFAGPVKDLPLWFTPIGNLYQTSYVLREKNTQKSGAQLISEALGGDVTLKGLTKRGFDGRRIHFLFGDESGKWKRVNVVKWIARQIKAMMAMGKRIGFAWIPTTAEEIEEGGREFRQLFEDSDVKTMKDGKYPTTKSKLMNLFIPAFDGWPGWVGPYGESIIDYPDDEQWAHMEATNPEAERIGAKAMLERDVNQALEENDEEGAALLRREAPFKPSDAWSGLNTNCPFEVNIMTRLKIVVEVKEFQDEYVIKGKFINRGDMNNPVIAFDKNDVGPWHFTWFPPNTGQTKWERGGLVPINTQLGKIGVDPYDKGDTKTKGSKLGVSGRRTYDKNYEAEHRDYKMINGVWRKDYRPSPSRFARLVIREERKSDFDQLIMGALFLSMPMSIENNRAESLFNRITEWKLDAFILREWKILGIKQPSEKQFKERGAFSGESYDAHSSLIKTAVEHYNSFLRGDAMYLGDDQYKLPETPLRWAFPEDIQTALDFDPNDRGKSDSTIAELYGELADWNMNDYGNPIHYNRQESPVSRGVVPLGFYKEKAGSGTPINFFDPNRKKINLEQQ